MGNTPSPNSTISALLRLPPELLNPILLLVLESGIQHFTPDFSRHSRSLTPPGVALHPRLKSARNPDDPNNSNPPALERTQWSALLFVNKHLHHTCLDLLSEHCTGSTNSLIDLQRLSVPFRQSIRNIVVHVDPSQRGTAFDYAAWSYTTDPDRSPVFFEKVVEDLLEVLLLMNGVREVQVLWHQFFGNAWAFGLLDRFSRAVVARLKVEMWERGRNVKWSAGHLYPIEDVSEGREEDGGMDRPGTGLGKLSVAYGPTDWYVY